MTDRRKLMQIGFAALLARKQTVQKQYLYEDRTDGGFVFEPILRNNEPMMANEEYMRKKYYSQVVYEGTMDGSIDTSIQEGTPIKELLGDYGLVEKELVGPELVKVDIWQVYNPVFLKLKE